MASAAPLPGDSGNVGALGTDGDAPAVILWLRIFRDGAPRLDAGDVGEGIDVLFPKNRGDMELFLDFLGEEIIGDPVLGDLEMRKDVAEGMEGIEVFLIHRKVGFMKIEPGRDEGFGDGEGVRRGRGVEETAGVPDDADVEVARGFFRQDLSGIVEKKIRDELARGGGFRVQERRPLGDFLFARMVVDLDFVPRVFETRVGDSLFVADVADDGEEITALSAFEGQQVIVATGSTPRVLRGVPGYEKMVEACEYLTGTPVGQKVAVVGGGLTGSEIAYELALQGKEVAIVEMKDDLISQKGVCLANSSYLREWFALHKVPVYLETTLKEVKDGSIVCTGKSGEVEIPCDSVICSAGYLPAPIAKEGGKVHLVGDCRKVGNLRSVIWRAYEVAMAIK